MHPPRYISNQFCNTVSKEEFTNFQGEKMGHSRRTRYQNDLDFPNSTMKLNIVEQCFHYLNDTISNPDFYMRSITCVNVKQRYFQTCKLSKTDLQYIRKLLRTSSTKRRKQSGKEGGDKSDKKEKQKEWLENSKTRRRTVQRAADADFITSED